VPARLTLPTTATPALGNDTSYWNRPVATIQVEVANCGVAAGDEVLMLFGAPPGSDVDSTLPRQQLLAFRRVRTLQRGEHEQVSFGLTVRDFSVVSAEGGRYPAAGEWQIWLGSDRVAQRPVTIEVQLGPLVV
jgi:hypothetical protein